MTAAERVPHGPRTASRARAVSVRLGVVVGVLAAAGCSSSGGGTTERTLTVFAASSLSKAFAAEGEAFEEAHPGVTVTFSFAGSQSLVAQVQQGAPADVLATADVATAESVATELAGEPQVFAHNSLAIVTPKDNPGKVATLADLAKVKVVLAGPTVPVGKAARKALDAAGVKVTPVSLEDNVSAVVTKVALGEADAGIAYVTDLQGNDQVAGTPLDGTRTDLAVAPLKDAGDDADDFVAFLLSDEGQAVLRSFGFS